VATLQAYYYSPLAGMYIPEGGSHRVVSGWGIVVVGLNGWLLLLWVAPAEGEPAALWHTILIPQAGWDTGLGQAGHDIILG
jgi:hypothetical protein